MLTAEQTIVLNNILSRVGIGVVVTDKNGKVMRFNGAATNLLGIAEEKTAPEDWPEVYGLYLDDGITLCPKEQSPLLRAVRGEEAENITMCIRRSGGSAARWCNLSLSPLRQESGEHQGAVLIVQDITDRKLLADAERSSNEALQQFAWVAAHDLQEPLRSVTGFLDLLSMHLEEKLDQKAQHYIARTHYAVKRMRTLISDLLTYSRLQTKEPVLRTVDCNKILKECVETLDAAIRDRDARVTFNQLPTLKGDSARLAQLFQNLVGNALKFSARDKPPEVTIAAERQPSRWLFSVKDNGIGLDMQYAERVFIAFQRLTSHQSTEGTGIGLAICKKIVEQHGGKIWIESAQGAGSTVFFTINSI
ncbi:MAG TPA: ATP-binding protein [Oculatellaceae cyanobacterium]